MNKEEKLKKTTKENVLDTESEGDTQQEILSNNNGRTVILRDNLGEIVLSSTNKEDTLQSMLQLAHQQKIIQAGNAVRLPPGPRFYHG